MTTAADDNFFFFFFSEKTSLDISCELSKKKIECRQLKILLGSLRVNSSDSKVHLPHK